MKRILILIVTTVFFISCTVADSSNGSFYFETGDPGLHGFHVDSLESATRFLAEAVEKQWIPGAVAMIIKDGTIVYEEAVGFSDREEGISMQTDNIFRLASLTKPITSFAVLMLYDRGMLDLHDQVSMYLPEFSNATVVQSVDFADSTWTARPASREVTIHDLLTHTSGITYGFMDSTMSAIYKKANVPDLFDLDGRRIEESISALGSLPLQHDPGEMWTYGLNIDVLGRIVEVISGEALDHFFRSEIFDPLEMNSTWFYIPEESADRLAPLYHHPESNTLEKLAQYSLGDDVSINTTDYYIGDGTFISGGGGLVSTARDYQKYIQMIVNEGHLGDTRLISSNTARLLFENQIGDLRFREDGMSYGYQVNLEDGDLRNGRKPGRLGWGGLFQTTHWMLPSENLTVVLMSQVNPSLHRAELHNGFEQRVNNSLN